MPIDIKTNTNTTQIQHHILECQLLHLMFKDSNSRELHFRIENHGTSTFCPHLSAPYLSLKNLEVLHICASSNPLFQSFRLLNLPSSRFSNILRFLHMLNMCGPIWACNSHFHFTSFLSSSYHAQSLDVLSHTFYWNPKNWSLQARCILGPVGGHIQNFWEILRKAVKIVAFLGESHTNN